MNTRHLSLLLTAGCAATWIVTAIHPLDRSAWILENILLVIFVIVLALTYRVLALSRASVVCLALFLILHMVGAHYTYAQMPIGFWVGEWLGLTRNPYDRFAHAAFGFLLVFPIRELLLRFGKVDRNWSFWLAISMILGVSGVFEIIEAIVAEMVAPGKGVDWLGGQGDEWDAQNDMLAALIGSLLMMGFVWLSERRQKSV